LLEGNNTVYPKEKKKKRKINPVDCERDNVFPFFVESINSQRIYIFESDHDNDANVDDDDGDHDGDVDETQCIWPIVKGIYCEESHVTHAVSAFTAVKGCDNEVQGSQRRCVPSNRHFTCYNDFRACMYDCNDRCNFYL